uniref:Uncharacterized protein n=1 Tax=Timema bartmani TaxID=61472 RepID=A0A7R9I9Y8_9NEOP|nr:unnamed protein product [Timema bartmani]
MFSVQIQAQTLQVYSKEEEQHYKLLHEIGFSWRKTSERKMLMEDVNVAAKRIAFLRECRKQ